MHMTSSGLQSFYYSQNSGSLALPIGVPCVVGVYGSNEDQTVALQGTCYSMYGFQSSWKLSSVKSTSSSTSNYVYYAIVRIS